MKKIVSAVALAAVAAGLATADVKTSLNVRLGSNVFDKTVAGDKSGKDDTLTIGDMDAVTGTDALTFKASNDYAGVTLNYNPKLSTTTDNSAKNFWASGNGVELTGYLNPADWLQLKVGAHKDGIFYAEQVKKDTDDTNWSAAGKYAFLNKLGIQTKASTGYYLDSMTDVQNGGQLFGLADFKAGVGGGNLLVRLTAVDAYDNTTSKAAVDWLQDTSKAADDAKMYVVPGAMVAFKNDAVNVNLDFQMPTNKDIAFGIYASPLGLLDGALTGVLGFTFSTNTSDTTDNLGWSGITRDTSFYAVDFRVRYVAGDFHIANAFNFTGSSEDDAVKPANSLSGKTGDLNIWDAIFLTYKLNDNWTITGDVQVNATTGVGANDDTYLDLYVTPGVMYTAGKGATITTGLYMAFKDVTDSAEGTLDKSTEIALPVIFRVKL
ncbi:MAG: hypothetical protein IJ530_04540 [Treponema sp.]|uniref:hypothetical protein n=1 Tax=Treponema sp. TaxID=166 RepID=UPI0025E8FDE7|nr:hypothetical protein [Treponema sp.]MBQ8679012.1 hypothetical protein [Treponema sp.]